MPATVRAGVALALTILLTPTVVALVPAADGFGGAAMIVAELTTGLAIGWLARLPVIALSMTGAIISTMVGLSSVVQPDPALGGQSSALARLLGLAAPALVLSSGLYTLPLYALGASYQLVRPGAGLPTGPMADSIQGAVSAAFALSVQLASPFILAGLLVQGGLGLLARLVPQLQVFSAAVPGQILGGVVLLGLLAEPILATWGTSLRGAWSALPGL